MATPPEDEALREPQVSIIIPNYNTSALLRRCLASLREHPPECSFEVIVVDDASSDGSVEMVRGEFPEVQLIANERNRGYARSNNHAFSISRGRFVYMLNSDAELLPGAVDRLVEFLKANAGAGAAGSLLYNDDGSLQASVKALPSARSAIFGKRSVLARYFPSNPWVRKELRQWKGADEKPFQAGYVSSASLMIPRQVLERVGDLDTRLWHFIDADYCKRIWDLGLAVYCVPAAKAIHREHRGGTMAGWRKRFRSTVTFHYGAYIYHRKHSGRSVLHPASILVVLGLGARFVVSLAIQAIKEVLGMDRQVYGRGASGRSA